MLYLIQWTSRSFKGANSLAAFNFKVKLIKFKAVIGQYWSGIYSQNGDHDWLYSQKNEGTWKVRNGSYMLIPQLGQIHM